MKAIASGFFMFLLAAASPTWNPDPWLADLGQVRAAIDEDYPNRDWLIGEREVSLDRWFDRTAEAIRAGNSDGNARQSLDQLIRRFNDGHVVIQWPVAVVTSGAGNPDPLPSSLVPSVAAFCSARGYDSGQVTAGTAVALPGYRAIDGGGPFKAGLVNADGKIFGVVRIGVFSPQGYPTLCEQAVAKARIAIQKPCDAACDDRLLTEAYAIMTQGLMTTVNRLRAAGAQVWKGPLIVLVDNETWSAAEQFTALLQDNGAAVVMGTRTGGAGCGHIDDNDPITLKHRGAKLELPNCVRFRKDGTNEVSGVVPDVYSGVRWNAGPTFAGRLTFSQLPEALAKADALLAGKQP